MDRIDDGLHQALQDLQALSSCNVLPHEKDVKARATHWSQQQLVRLDGQDEDEVFVQQLLFSCKAQEGGVKVLLEAHDIFQNTIQRLTGGYHI